MGSMAVYFVFIFVVRSVYADRWLYCLLKFLNTLRCRFCYAGNAFSRIAISSSFILPFRHSEGINESYDPIILSIAHKVVRSDLNYSIY
jgi:hypothetical protein